MYIAQNKKKITLKKLLWIINKQDRKYKGSFSSDNENFNFEVIDNTLVIKNGETVVKSISGDNY